MKTLSETIDRLARRQARLEAALAPFAASIERDFPDLGDGGPLGWHPDAAVFVRATVADCRALMSVIPDKSDK